LDAAATDEDPALTESRGGRPSTDDRELMG
jgi:hypothetical protein